ncbi:unnamed protein product, partial [Hymenolepis diminuta]
NYLCFPLNNNAHVLVIGSCSPFSSSARSPLYLLSLASILVVAYLNTFWPNQPFLFYSTIVVSSYSNSSELVTVTVIVIC